MIWFFWNASSTINSSVNSIAADVQYSECKKYTFVVCGKSGQDALRDKLAV